MSMNFNELMRDLQRIKVESDFNGEQPPSTQTSDVELGDVDFQNILNDIKSLSIPEGTNDPENRSYWERFQEMTADFNPIQKAIAYSTYPIQWLLDTTPGRFLQNISEGGAKALIGEQDYMRERDISTGNEAVDKVAQTVGSFAAPLVLMSQVGGQVGQGISQTVASNPALWNVSPSVLSALRNAATGLASMSIQDAMNPDFNPTWKDYAGRAAFMGGAGAASAASMPYIHQLMPGVHPLAETALSSAAGGFAGSVASLPFSWSELEGEGLEKVKPALQKVGLDTATYAVFGTLMAALNPTTWGDRSPQARNAAIKTLDAYQKRMQALLAGNQAEADRYGKDFERWGRSFFHYSRQVMNQSGKEMMGASANEIVKMFGNVDPRDITPQEFAKFLEIKLQDAPLFSEGTVGGTAGQQQPQQSQQSETTPQPTPQLTHTPTPIAGQLTQAPIAGELPLLTETRLQQLDTPTTSFNVRTGQVEETPLTDRALNLIIAVREFYQAGDTPNYPILLGNILGAGREYQDYVSKYGDLANHPERESFSKMLSDMGLTREGFSQMLSAVKQLESEIEPSEQQFVSVPGFGRQTPSGLVPVDPIAVKPGDVVYDPRGKQFTVDSIDSARGLLRVTDQRGVQTSLGVNVARTLAETATEEAGAEIETEPVEIPTAEESVVESPLIESQTETSDNIPEEIPGSEIAQKPLGDIDPAFKKVDFEGGTLRQVVLYNPETKETLRVTVDDAEYPRGASPFLKYPPEVLERLARAPIDKEAQKLWKRNFGEVFVGDVVEVVKGRKYPHGTRGVVSRVYDYKIPNSSRKVPYVELEDGKRVALSNVRYVDENAEQTLTPETPIAQQEESIPIEELVAKTREAIEQNKDTIEMAWLGERLLPGVRLGEAYDVAKMYVMLQDGTVNQTEYDNFIADLKRSGKVSGLDAPQTDVAAPSDVQTPIVDQILTEPAKGRETPVIDSQAETSVVAELPQVSETDTTTETTTIDSLADDLKGISPRAEVTMRYLMDQDIGRVIRDIETGAESKEAALTLYERAAEALQLSPEARAVHLDRIRGAKEPAEIKERPIIEPTGNVSVAYTPVKQIEVQTRFEVVPIEDVLSSEQEGFPALLQPRKAVSADERRGLINQIKRNLNPARLEHSPNASDGSPIVNNRLEVEAGNGRVLALREMAREGHENYDLYKQWLLDNSRRLGLDPEKISQIENPILVRVRTNAIENVREYVEDANVSSVTRHSAAEQASIDAGNMTQGLMNLFVPNESGVIDTAANREFIQTFMNEVVPESERNSYYTGGKLNVEGYRRVQGAILAKAFGENYRLLTSMLESTDDNVKKVSNGLLAVAPHLSRIKDGIAQGHYHDLDITYELAEAANKLASLKAEGQSVDAYLRQIQLPGMDDLGSLSRLLLQKLDEFGGGRRGSQKKVATFLKNYTELVEEAGSPNQMQLPGLETEVPSKAVLIEAASSPKAMGVAERQNTLLFDEGGVTGEERVQEPAPSRPERSQEVGEQVDSPSAEETTSETGTDRRVKMHGLIEKYALQDAAKNAISQNKHNVIGQFLAAIEQLDDLSSEQANKFAEKLASEATILFATPRESRFYGREQNELISWLDNFVRVARIMEEQNIPATTEEVMVASGNDKLIKMNLQLFGGKRDGKKSESEWQELFASFFTDTTGESSGVGEVIDAGTSERVPSVEDGKEEGKVPGPQGEVGAAQEAVVELDELPPIGEPPPVVNERTNVEPFIEREPVEKIPVEHEIEVIITPHEPPPDLVGKQLEQWKKEEAQRQEEARNSRFVVRDTWDGEFKAVSKEEVIKKAVDAVQKAQGTAEHVLEQLKEMDTRIEAKKPGWLKRMFDYDMTNAELIVEILQGQENEGVLHKYLFKDIDTGVNVKHSVERQLKEGLTDIIQSVKPKDFKRWSKWFVKKPSQAYTVKIELTDGKSITLTKDERMEFYAHAQCAEWNLENLLKGGFAFYDNQGAIHKLSEEDLGRILSTVTPKEKQIVDRVVKELIYPAVLKYGNPVSQILWGDDLTRFDWYFPITHPETTIEHNAEAKDMEDLVSRSLTELSFTKSRTSKDMPVMIRGFFRSTLTFVNQFSDFAGLAIPVTNAKTILADQAFVNQMYKSGREHELNVLKDFINDVEGTRRRYELLEQLGDKLLKNISFSYIAANIGTILKQPISLVVAGTEIDIGANLFSAMKNHKRGLAEAIEKAPKAWKRSQGHYSPEASLIADSHEIMEVFHGDKRMKTMLTKPAEKTDLFGIGTIWNLTKDHVRKHYPELTGKQFDDKVVEIFDRTVNRTQSTSDLHTKSKIGRSKNFAVRAATLFTNERNKHFNVVRRAWWRYSNNKTPQNAAKLLKTLFLVGVVQSGLLMAAGKTRDKIVGKEPKFDFGETILDAIENALALTYGGSELFSAARSMAERGAYRGYEIESPITATINKTLRGVIGMYEAITQITSGEKYSSGYKKDQEKWETTLLRATDEVLSAIAAMGGVPYDTGKRYAKGLVYHLGGEEAYFEFDALTRNPTSTDYYEQLWDSLERGDKKGASEAMKILKNKFKVNPKSGLEESGKRRKVSSDILKEALTLYMKTK